MNNSIYEFCDIRSDVQMDSLSNFLISCGLSLKKFGYQTEMPQIRPRIYGDFELIYLLSGDGILTIDGKTYHGKTHDMFVLPKYSLCCFQNAGDPFENYFIHIELNDPVAEEQFKSLFPQPLLHLGEDFMLSQCYQWLATYYKNSESGGYLAIRSLLHLILVRVLHLSGAAEQNLSFYESYRNENSQYRLLQKSIELITERNGVINVTDLCNALFVSPTYLRRIFHHLLGQPLLSFIRSVRIRETEKRLLGTTASISEIAEELGFSSPYHFCNEFKKYHGVSPSAYRKLMCGS